MARSRIACFAVTAPYPAPASGEATRAMGLRMHGKCRAKIWRLGKQPSRGLSRPAHAPNNSASRPRSRRRQAVCGRKLKPKSSAAVRTAQRQTSSRPEHAFWQESTALGACLPGSPPASCPMQDDFDCLQPPDARLRPCLTKGGHKSYVVSYRGAGRKRRMHLKAGLTLSDARGEAKVFALIGPDPKGGSEDMIRRADPLQPCVKRVWRHCAQAIQRCHSVGSRLLEKADRFNAAEARADGL
jgi:hypothetical protein